MSLQRTETITCPHCHKDGEIEIWQSINVSLDPELRKKVMTGELWLWTCPHCGEQIVVPWGTIYHDMENKFMIFFSFDDEDVSEEDRYSKLDIPGEAGNMEGYTFRAVYGYNNFKERILILESEFDDIAIEHLRYMLRHVSNPELAEQDIPLFLEDVKREKTEKSEYGEMIFTFHDPGDDKTYALTIPLEEYFEHKFAVKQDPRMQLNGNACVDEGWIERQLKNR